MQLIVLQENLIKALTSASHIVTTKAQMPVLSNLKLEASKQGLTISSTDLEIGLRIKIGAKVEEPGMISVPARIITELISNAGPGNLNLSLKKEELHITGSGLKANLAGMSADEFPSLPEFNLPVIIELPLDNFNEAVHKVSFAAATDESRPILTAIQLKILNSQMELSATDGFRLSWVKTSSLPEAKNSSSSQNLAEGEKHETKTFLIPARALLEISRLIDQSVKHIQLATTEKQSQIIFKLGDVELVSRLVSGDFPDIKKVMPDSGDTTMEIDCQELTRAMRLAAIFARESANIVKFNINPGQLSITANAPQVGDQESTVDISLEGPKAQIAFNYRYILDFLNACSSRTVKFMMTNALGPGLWLEVGSKDDKKSHTILEYKHVIMPVRVENSETS